MHKFSVYHCITHYLGITLFAIVSTTAIAIPTERTKRAAGGVPIDPTKIPSFAVVIYNGELACGGTFVSTHHIVTAAHCAYNERNKQIIAPDKFILSQNGTILSVTIRKVALFPGYNTEDTFTQFGQELAVLHLEQPANVQPLAWHSATGMTINSFLGEQSKTMKALGLRRDANEISYLVEGNINVFTQKACLTLLDERRCYRFHSAERRTVYNEIHDKLQRDGDSTFCALNTDSYQITKGDSGLPLYFQDSAGTHILAGVIAITLAQDTGFPTLTFFTSVSSKANKEFLDKEIDVHAYFFLKNGYYLRYNYQDAGFIESGPRKMDEDWAIPNEDASNVIGVAEWYNGMQYFFLRNGNYIAYDVKAKRSGYSVPITNDEWPGLEPYRTAINAVLNWNNGKVFFFLNNGTYLRVDIQSKSVDPGYPADIGHSWPGLENYKTQIASAINWNNGKIYFFLTDGRYLRYDTLRDTVETGYPTPMTPNNWPGLARYNTQIVGGFVTTPQDAPLSNRSELK